MYDCRRCHTLADSFEPQMLTVRNTASWRGLSVFFVRWRSLLFHYIGGSSQFLVEDEDEVKDFSFWELGELSPPLLGARSLQFSYDQKATYQEAKGLSATKRLNLH